MLRKPRLVGAALVVALLTACAARQVGTTPSAISTQDAETEQWAIAAALLDPRCYTMDGTTTGGLDLTVPAGHAWHVVNAFAVYYGDPIDVAQDGADPRNLLTRRTGFIRPLDARRALTLGAGTRIRSNRGINTAYLLYCDPQLVWDVDPRYASDPRGLYYERRQRLRSIPTQMVALEGTSGGAIDDDIHADLPAVPLLITSASVYDASWVTVGCPGWSSPANVLDEINNEHGVRIGDGIEMPLVGCGARVALEKGTLGDTWGPATSAIGVSASSSPAIAMPQHCSGNLTYQLLPDDW